MVWRLLVTPSMGPMRRRFHRSESAPRNALMSSRIFSKRPWSAEMIRVSCRILPRVCTSLSGGGSVDSLSGDDDLFGDDVVELVGRPGGDVLAVGEAVRAS